MARSLGRWLHEPSLFTATGASPRRRASSRRRSCASPRSDSCVLHHSTRNGSTSCRSKAGSEAGTRSVDSAITGVQSLRMFARRSRRSSRRMRDAAVPTRNTMLAARAPAPTESATAGSASKGVAKAKTSSGAAIEGSLLVGAELPRQRPCRRNPVTSVDVQRAHIGGENARGRDVFDLPAPGRRDADATALLRVVIVEADAMRGRGARAFRLAVVQVVERARAAEVAFQTGADHARARRREFAFAHAARGDPAGVELQRELAEERSLGKHMVLGARVSLDVAGQALGKRLVVRRFDLRVLEIETLDLAQRPIERLARREGVRRLDIGAFPVGVVIGQSFVADARFRLERKRAASPRESDDCDASLHVFTSRRTHARSSSGSKGLAMYSFAPASRLRATSLSCVLAVSTMTGTACHPGVPRMSLRSS